MERLLSTLGWAVAGFRDMCLSSISLRQRTQPWPVLCFPVSGCSVGPGPLVASPAVGPCGAYLGVRRPRARVFRRPLPQPSGRVAARHTEVIMESFGSAGKKDEISDSG